MISDADFETSETQSQTTAEAPPAAPAAPESDTRSAPTPPASAKAERPTASAIVRYEPGSDQWAMQLEPADMRQANWLAHALFDSRLFGFSNPEGCLAALMLGRSLGLPSMAILRNVHNVKGKLALHASLIVGLVLKSPLCEYFLCVETTHKRAVYETKRRGAPMETRLEYTIEDATMAGLSRQDGSWQKTPRTMLRHRCATELARMVYPDLVSGVYAPEELVDNAEDLPRDLRAA